MGTISVSKSIPPICILDRAIIEDKSLSFRARGVLAYILSQPDDYDAHLEQLVAQSPSEGKEALRATMIELEKAGYILRRRKNDHGRIRGWETLVYDERQEGIQSAQRDTPTRATQRAEKRAARELVSKDYPRIFIELGRLYGFSCQQCNSAEDLQIDHILPLSKGGKSKLDNLQLLCKPCNMRKGTSVEG